MKYTKKFLKYTALGLLAVIMLASLTLGFMCTLAGILGIILAGNIQYLLLIPIALFCLFIGFVAFDCCDILVDKWNLG